ncbi:MAG: type IV pilin N-terminal domain-containing protein [Methanoregula sp.]|nr:type IV pilin N-terminal domain-containing protein [Methanoregula sp.]
MKKKSSNNLAVSGVVGEMLMIGIVLILAAVFSSQLPNYLPSERSPSVTIMMSNDTSGNITFWHKGGDWVKINSIKVIVSNQSAQDTFTSSDSDFIYVPVTSTFDLGGNITVKTNVTLDKNVSIVLATDRAVLFSGKVGGQ